MNLKQLQQLKAAGKIRGFQQNGREVKLKQEPKFSKEKDWLSTNLQYWANHNSLELVTEHRFCEERKFRFDWAFPAIKIAVEYEGIFSKKSRHTSNTGFVRDVEKYNMAVAKGWRVIRATAKDYKDVINILNQIF